MQDDEIKDLFGHPQIGRPAVHDRFIVVIFLAVQTKAVTVDSEVSDDHLVVPFLDNGRVQHVTFV